MSSKKEILNKIKILITQSFDYQEDAFSFFDKNESGTLSKKEIVSLLKKAKISRFLRGIIANKLIQGYDESGDKQIGWKEFKKAVKEM